MKSTIQTVPSIRIFYDPVKDEFMVMEMAMVDPGHCVGWGAWKCLSSADATTQLLPHVFNSLRTFFERDGNIVSRRLKVESLEPLSRKYDLVVVRLQDSDSYKLVGYCRTERNHVAIKGNDKIVQINISPTEFCFQLRLIFQKIAGGKDCKDASE
jgi:hypothetical protein